MSLKQRVIQTLKNLSFSPNPNLGQHFIIDEKYLQTISHGLDKNSIAIEVGPGIGQLTEILVKICKKVVAIEIDRGFEKPLTLLKNKYRNLSVIFDDALSNSLDKAVANAKRQAGRVFLISNLPYQITEPFLNKIARYKNLEIRLMVGDSLAYHAKIQDPTDPDFTELSLLCNSFFTIREVAKVPKESFFPEPKTGSTILEFVQKTLDNKKNMAELISQRLFLSQTKGSKLKNFLMNAFIMSDDTLTKNKARDLVTSLNIPEIILEKSFAQLNNSEVRTLYGSLLKLNNL